MGANNNKKLKHILVDTDLKFEFLELCSGEGDKCFAGGLNGIAKSNDYYMLWNL